MRKTPGKIFHSSSVFWILQTDLTNFLETRVFLPQAGNQEANHDEGENQESRHDETEQRHVAGPIADVRRRRDGRGCRQTRARAQRFIPDKTRAELSVLLCYQV